MSDKPILFSGPMVRALLDGRKSQTRRVLKPQPPHGLMPECIANPGEAQPIGAGWSRGDRLWVRETWTARMVHGWTIADARSRMYQEEILYRADGHDSIDGWWPSIHMPREFSRLTLIVTDVRVQRLQEISEADALAEGLMLASNQIEEFWRWPEPLHERLWLSPVAAFRDLWDGLNAARGYGWGANPWVCAVMFEAHHSNIDQMEASHDQH